MLRGPNEEADIALVRQLIFRPIGLNVSRFSRAETLTGRTPDFRVLRCGNLVAYSEVKSPRDDWIDEQLNHAAPGQIVGGARDDPTFNRLEPISKSSEEDDEASELHEAKEVLWIKLPAHEKAAVPLNPGEEPFDQPTPRISPKPAAILRSAFAAIGSVRCDHLDAVFTYVVIQRIAVIGAIADQIVRLGFDHVEVEAELHQADFVMVRGVRADRER